MSSVASDKKTLGVLTFLDEEAILEFPCNTNHLYPLVGSFCSVSKDGCEELTPVIGIDTEESFVRFVLPLHEGISRVRTYSRNHREAMYICTENMNHNMFQNVFRFDFLFKSETGFVVVVHIDWDIENDVLYDCSFCFKPLCIQHLLSFQGCFM